jgi:hypothetical protein
MKKENLKQNNIYIFTDNSEKISLLFLGHKENSFKFSVLTAGKSSLKFLKEEELTKLTEPK